MKKITAIALLIILVLAGLGYWYYQKQHGKTSDDLVFYGNVDVRQVSLAFEGSGRIKQLNVEEGDIVQAGQILAVLDSTTLNIQRERAETQIEVQQQNVLQLKNGARTEEIAQAKAKVVAAQAQAQQAQQEFNRLNKIANSVDRNAISQSQLDQARATFDTAQAQVKEVQEALRLLQAGTRHEEIASAEAQLKAGQADLSLLQHQIALTSLQAPGKAVVRSRLLEIGDMASSQLPVYTLALLDPKWVRIYVAEKDLGKIKSGMKAQVRSDSYPDQAIKGRVGYISSVAEFTPKSVQTEDLRTTLVYEVRIIVQDPQQRLRLGQPVTVNLVQATTP